MTKRKPAAPQGAAGLVSQTIGARGSEHDLELSDEGPLALLGVTQEGVAGIALDQAAAAEQRGRVVEGVPELAGELASVALGRDVVVHATGGKVKAGGADAGVVVEED